MTTKRELELTRLYDQLARYQWWMRRWSRAKPGEGLAMRKRLRSGVDELAGVERLNDWLWSLAEIESRSISTTATLASLLPPVTWGCRRTSHHRPLCN